MSSDTLGGSATEPFGSRGSIRITRKGVGRFRRGHPWIYASDVKDPGLQAAGFVEAQGPDGAALGYALYSPRSQIRLRMFSSPEQPPARDLLRQRLEAAAARRGLVFGDADAYRLVHGEADLLPGVFIDRYADCFALQTTCEAADLLETQLVELLVERWSPRAVVLADDSGTRNRESLPRHRTLAHGGPEARARYHEGRIVLAIDLLADQKTGSYLDQSSNHRRVGELGRGRALDCFTYHGGFALQLALQCDSVIAVDISAAALEKVATNAEENRLLNIQPREANVFDLLPSLFAAGERFDTIVLDPPSFASGRKTVDAALRAYKEINLRALKLLRPGGLLVSCSCSGRVRGDDFDRVIEAASRDARRPLQRIESRAAGPDHPALVGVPETDYLKCRILRAV